MSHPSTVLGFGSCNKQHKNQSFWKIISTHLETKGSFISTGDIVYPMDRSISGLSDAFKMLTQDSYFQQFKKGIRLFTGVIRISFYTTHAYKLSIIYTNTLFCVLILIEPNC